MNTKPLSPKDITDNLVDIIPDAVIKAVNNLLKVKYRGGEAVLRQCDIIKEIQMIDPKMTSRELFDNHYMDFESIFQKIGWKVEYDKPGYSESYEPTYTFTPKK